MNNIQLRRKVKHSIIIRILIGVVWALFWINIVVKSEQLPIDDTSTYNNDYEPQYGFTEDEIYLLAQVLCGDSEIDGDGEYDFAWAMRNEYPYDFVEVSKVLCVIMNRVKDDRFPNTVADVILQKGQFDVIPRNLQVDPGAEAIGTIEVWCEAYDYYCPDLQVIPLSHCYFEAGPNNTNITKEDWR